MPDVKWTKDQLNCIKHRGCDLLVSAAAGSGKTAVLVERVIRLVSEEKVDIDRLLVVTFTNVAAAQMKAKIEQAIHEKLRQNPQNKHLKVQLQRLNRAKITTIHSFCRELIRENFHLCDVSPDVSVADAQEAQLLKTESIFEAMECFFEDAQRELSFSKFLDSFCKGKDMECEILLAKAYDFVRSIPFYKNWLYDKVMEYHDIQSIEKTKMYDLIKIDIIEQVGYIKDFFERWEEQLQNAQEDGLLPYVQTLQEDKEQFLWLEYVENLSYSELCETFCNICFGRLNSLKKEYDEEKAEVVRGYRDAIKDLVSGVVDNYFYDGEKNILKCINDIFPELFTLYELIVLTDTIYTQKKVTKNVIDFNDLEHKAIEILAKKENNTIKQTEKAIELADFYHEILIDEYQDSNDVQELIFSQIANKNMFMVGDIKQSIYKFRNAKPELFLEKYNRFSEENNSENRKILLSKNFRSREEILEFTNFIFEHIMSEKTGGISYHDNEKLYRGADYPKNAVPIELYVIDDVVDDDFTITPKRKEAHLIADQIEKMVGTGEIFDNGAMRKINYSDIMVLYRAAASSGKVLASVLSERNIPNYCEGQGDYFGRYEVNLMLCMLQVIDNPRNDIPLCAVLYSPFYLFSDDELAEIRLQSNGDFFDCVTTAAKNGDKKCADFLTKLQAYRSYKNYHTIEELINRIIEDTGYLYYVAQKPDGALRQANLLKLCDMAKNYESTVYRGLYSFIHYVNLLIESQTNISESVPTGVDCVTIMSIHKSKGLESNVVIVGGLNGKINKRDTYAPILFDNTAGIGCNFKNTQNNSVIKTIFKTAIAQKQKKEILAEELRILYVALTRAKQKLVLTATSRDFEREIALVRKNITGINKQPYAVTKSSSYLQYILVASLFMEQAAFLGDKRLAYKPCGFTLKATVYDDYQIEVLEQKEKEPRVDGRLPFEEKHIFDMNLETIKAEMDFTYPDLSNVPKKLSVSEIKRKYDIVDEGNDFVFLEKIGKQENIPKIEDALFLRERSLKPVQKGTALHTFVEHLGFDRTTDLFTLAAYLEKQNILTKAEKESLNFKKIEKFRQSNLYLEICDADTIHQEDSFLTEIPAKKLYPEIQTDETIMVQGTIDCWYEKDGTVKIVDYKTDFYKEPNEILEKYRVQLQLYRYALERKTGKTISDCILYLFYRGDVVKISELL